MKTTTTLLDYFKRKPPPSPLWRQVARELGVSKVICEALRHMSIIITKGVGPMEAEIQTYRCFHLHVGVGNCGELSDALQRLRLEIQGPADQ